MRTKIGKTDGLTATRRASRPAIIREEQIMDTIVKNTKEEAAAIAADKWCEMLFGSHIQDNGARECEFMCMLATALADHAKKEITEESKIKTRELLKQYYLHEIINDKVWLAKTLGTYTDYRGETCEFNFFDRDLYCDYHPRFHLRRILSIAGIEDGVAESIAPFKTGIEILHDEHGGYTAILKTYGRRQTLAKKVS